MSEWPRLRPRIAKLAAALAVLGGSLLAASAVANDGCRPTITGDPIVGHVLGVTFSSGDSKTATDSKEFDGLYRWQSCDPATADCFASTSHSDPNWTDLPAPDPDLHKDPTYTIVSS